MTIRRVKGSSGFGGGKEGADLCHPSSPLADVAPRIRVSLHSARLQQGSDNLRLFPIQRYVSLSHRLNEQELVELTSFVRPLSSPPPHSQDSRSTHRWNTRDPHCHPPKRKGPFKCWSVSPPATATSLRRVNHLPSPFCRTPS